MKVPLDTRWKWYNNVNKRNAPVVVPFKVRKDAYAVRARNRYRKWWVLKNVTFTLGNDRPTRAPPHLLHQTELILNIIHYYSTTMQQAGAPLVLLSPHNVRCSLGISYILYT